MSQNLDKNKICDALKKAKPQNLLYLTVNDADKDSKKNALAELNKFIGKGNGEIIFIRN